MSNKVDFEITGKSIKYQSLKSKLLTKQVNKWDTSKKEFTSCDLQKFQKLFHM